MMIAQARARGFGLLEAVVALALLAGTGMALFAWINQSLTQASRLRYSELQSRLQLSALALVETIDPMRLPEGQREAGPIRVSWRTAPLQPERRNASFQAAEAGVWQVGLYALAVHATDSSTGVEVRFEQWRVGTRRLTPVLPENL
jgi:general secretion pathway protein I